MSFKITSKARAFAVQFLYQCEAEQIFYFSEGVFDRFSKHFELTGELKKITLTLCQGALDNTEELDRHIQTASKRWTVGRMAATDRAILRLATHELLESNTPVKVILNEAIKLGKRFGTENSGPFINGVLDAIAKQKGNPK